MRKIAALIAAVPFMVIAQETGAPPAPQAAPPAPAAPPAQYAPPPQYAPPAAPSPPQPYQPRQKRRDTWYIGFGLGAGDGKVKTDTGTVDFKNYVYSDRTSAAVNFRVGATVSPRLLVGLDAGGVGSFAEEAGYASIVQLNYYDAGIMYFPVERGFFLRAGAGLSAIVQNIDSPLGKHEFSANGFNVLGGVGYAFWLGRTFNLTVNLDAQAHSFSKANVEGGTAWGAWIGFDWY